MDVLKIFNEYKEIATVLIGVIAFWWRAAKTAARYEVEFGVLKDAVAKNIGRQEKLVDMVTTLVVKIDEREKDTTRLEGALELQRRDMMEVVKGLHQATSSLDAMWRTLQTMFPDRVRKSASDRG